MSWPARAALVSSVLLSGSAWSFPACGSANPALTTIGADQPFAHRVRLASTVRAWAQQEGAAQVDASTTRELRLDLTASWSPSRRWTLVLNVPLQVRERTDVSLAKERGFGPGELDLSARVLLVGTEGLRPRHLVSLVGSARLPTAPTLKDGAGRVFAVDAQLGPGAFVPTVGLFWSAFMGDQWSTFVSLLGDVPFEGRYGLRAGPGVQLVGSAQFKPWKWLGVRAGLDGRYEGTSFFGGVADPSLSGLLLQALVEVALAPASSVQITAGARIPFVDTRAGPVSTTPLLLLSVVVDV